MIVTEHSRIRRRYERGETIPLYGLARRDHDGKLSYWLGENTRINFSRKWVMMTPNVISKSMLKYMSKKHTGLFVFNARKNNSPIDLSGYITTTRGKVFKVKEK